MKRINFNIKDRKTLTLGLCLVAVCVFTLTIAYAALNAVLTIQGNARVSAADWDIYLDNVKVTSGSVSGTTPLITSPTTVTFSTTLNMPGEFYEFTIDVVNDGSIDAMIDGIKKTPTLTTSQAKYFNYIVEYENGESINTKQLVAKKSFVRLKVRVEFRKDLVASDLPTKLETLNLSFTVNYVQSDGSGNEVMDGGVLKLKVVSGDYDTTGSEICIKEECFYVISSTTDTVTMFAKYNLHVGNEITGVNTETGEPIVNAIANPSGKQDSSAKGLLLDSDGFPIFPIIGTVAFSNSIYWEDDNGVKSEYGTDYPIIDVYDSNSSVFQYIENYKTYLTAQGVAPIEARLITIEDIINVDFSPEIEMLFISTSYWTSTVFGSEGDEAGILLGFQSQNGEWAGTYSDPYQLGVRPVIVISKDYFE